MELPEDCQASALKPESIFMFGLTAEDARADVPPTRRPAGATPASLIVLHAVWHEPHAILLWAELSGGGRMTRPGRHPSVANAPSVRDILRLLVPPGRGSDAGWFSPGEATLSLPTRAGWPIPSHPGLDPNGSEADEPASLSRWRVAGALLPAGPALAWLTALPSDGEQPPEVAYADDLAWFVAAARLGLDLVARERYVPTVSPAESGWVRVRWDPLLSAPGVLERLGVLTRAMPDSCRAEAAPVLPRDAVLHHFLGAAVDGFVRGYHDRPASPNSAAGKWLAALGPIRRDGADGGLPADDLAAALRDWVAPAIAAEPYEGYRTCYRLVPPPMDGSPDAAGRRPWHLEFMLQPVADPDQVVPASDLWRTGPPLTAERRERAQDRFLADLVQASRLFPPIGRALTSRRPKSAELTVHEAYGFLTGAASLLSEGGAAVLVPEELAGGGRRARLVTHVTITPVAKTAAEIAHDPDVRFDLSLAAGEQRLTAAELTALVEARLPIVQLRGHWVELRPGDIKGAMRLLAEDASFLSLLDSFSLSWATGEIEGLPVASVSTSGWVRDLQGGEAGGEPKVDLVRVPETFRGTLRPYQERGLAWMDFLRRLGVGACLADDMGLGKTIQALALLLRHTGEGEGRRPSLLVAPTSVLGNWVREAERFAPSLKVLLHDGEGRDVKTKFVRSAERHDLVVTSFALLGIDRETLTQVEWDTVLIDEAQNIKNPQARAAQAARGLKSRHRLALTGTPVENRLTELWSIFEFLNPGYLGTLEAFKANLANPIERTGSAEHATRLRRLVGPFLLRRAKSDPGILDELPPKIETTETCGLTREQSALYDRVVREMLDRIDRTQGIERKGLVLATLTKLKQVCDHPALYRKDDSPLRGRSGKLKRLDELLEEITAEGQRALVFTQYAEMAHLLRRHLAGTLRAEILLMDGATPRPERERLIDRFQDERGGPKVFVLSLKAGGTGLNLTAASHVIHYDRWWNPAVEAQATDRAHRIGQDKTVHVHAFVCAGTMEERIATLLNSKKALASRVVEEGEGWITELSTANLHDLFSLRAEIVEEEE